MLNKVQIIGNIGKDPEIRSTGSGSRVANFSVAVTERWKDKDGEKKERTEWVSVVVWSDGLIGVIEKYVHKGDKVYIEGKMQTRKWEKDGVDRYSTEVVLQGFDAKLIMLSGKSGDKEERDDGGSYARDGSGGGNQSRHTRPEGGGYSGSDATGRSSFQADLDDDSIPFITRDTIW